MPRDDRAISDFVEQSAAALASAGFPRMPARVLMTLMVTDEPGLTARELADYLGASAAGISGAVRYLQTVRMVHRISQPGSRRDRYEVPEHTWYTATLGGTNPTYETIRMLAARAVPAFSEPSSPGALRVQEMSDFFAFIQRRLPELLEEWRATRSDPPD